MPVIHLHIHSNDNAETDLLFRKLKNAELILKENPNSELAKQRVERYKQYIKRLVINGNT